MEKEGNNMEGLNFKPEQVKVVDINDVRPNSWNPKDVDTEEYRRVRLSIERNGLRMPVIVRHNPAGSSPYEIIDGEQRWRSCKDLNYDKVVIYDEGEVSDQRAKELTIWYQQQVPFNQVDLAHLVAELAGLEDFSVPYSEEQIQEFQNLTKFDFENFSKNDMHNIPDSEKMVTFSLPCTVSQLEIFEQAIQKCMEKADAEISKTKAVELIMADFLAGN